MKTLRIDLSQDFGDTYRGLNHNKGRSVALGYFDGVHRGHEELAHTVVQRAEELRLEPTMFSFDRYPKPVPPNTILNAVVPGQDSPTKFLLESPLPPVNYRFKGLIQTDRQRDRYFQRLGIELLILQEFNRHFADMEPEDFLDKIILEKLNTKVLVVGAGYRFSKNQRGDVAMLEKWCEKHNIEFHVIPPIIAGDEVVSSTRIRNAIESGDMAEVQRLLGEPFAIPGTVIHGNAIGRTIGMPTANFRMPSGMVIPKFGVYVSRTWIDNTYYDSITNFGLRPTVNHTDPQPLVETCILDRNVNLYDKYIEVEFLDFMRPEARFPSFIAMSNKIAEDLAYAREWHMNSSKTYLYAMRNDIPLYVSRSDRFNTAYLSLEFYLPMDKKRSSEYALLANIITAASNEFPTRPELKSYLDTHYGSEIKVDIAAINNMQRISFTLSTVHTGLDGSKPFEESYHLLLDMLLNPLRDQNDFFPANIVETERQNLLMLIRAQENNRGRYVLTRAHSELWPKEQEWVNPLGNQAEVSAIGSRELYDAWIRLISESQIRVFLGGKLESTSLADRVMEKLGQFPRLNNTVELIPGKFPEIMHFAEPKTKVERIAVDNAHLIIVFSDLPPYTSMKCASARVLNVILDGPFALLSTGLQNDLGMNYDVKSVYNSFQQTITLSVELAVEDVSDVMENLLHQIERIQEGDLSDSWFASAKQANHNRLLQIGDDWERSLRSNSFELLSGRKFVGESADYFAQSVQKENVIELAKKMNVQLRYIALPEGSPLQLWEKES